MSHFSEYKLPKLLERAIEESGFEKLTPIQQEAYPVILSGKDVVGIAQTGTGKTFAYLLPILKELKFSKQAHPRILILVPTRELAVQVAEQVERFTTYMNVRVKAAYGGVNINTQAQAIADGMDILVATPGRLYDLAVTRAVHLKSIHKLVIDEVDVMLDLGFRFQLTNIFELLPERRQNIMFSATMTEEVETLIEDFFYTPEKVAIAVSGTPLHNISQECYAVPNFYTKVNLLLHLLKEREKMEKVLVFVNSKKMADRLHKQLDEEIGSQVCVMHANKTQNYRLRAIQEFDEGVHRVMVTTEVMARGLDLKEISHVINFDTPSFPENYMHRIGRTGRAEQEGHAILFYTDKEKEAKEAIEKLMDTGIPEQEIPAEVEISKSLIPEERPKAPEMPNPHRNRKKDERGASHHEKKDKNKKVNLGGSYKRKIEKKYKKPKSRGDKNQNRRKKR